MLSNPSDPSKPLVLGIPGAGGNVCPAKAAGVTSTNVDGTTGALELGQPDCLTV